MFFLWRAKLREKEEEIMQREYLDAQVNFNKTHV